MKLFAKDPHKFDTTGKNKSKTFAGHPLMLVRLSRYKNTLYPTLNAPQVAGALDVSGAGYSSSGNITIATSGEARFSNSSFLMHQTEAVAITLEADREVGDSYVVLVSVRPDRRREVPRQVYLDHTAFVFTMVYEPVRI